MGGISPRETGGGSGGGGALGTYVAYASAAGAVDNVKPAATWPTGFGRIGVTLPGGAASWTGLVAGTDGQMALIMNLDAAANLSLDREDAGSLAANRFDAPGTPLVLPPGASVLAVYTVTVARWQLV